MLPRAAAGTCGQYSTLHYRDMIKELVQYHSAICYARAAEGGAGEEEEEGRGNGGKGESERGRSCCWWLVVRQQELP